jgi:Zn-finger nucleic acid-binding protein
MSTCEHCGAPLERFFDRGTTCGFCDRMNPPLQREVAVPVQVVHNVVQVIGPVGQDAAKELRCPHCRKRLVQVIAEGVELNGCGGCGGIWVDNESARRVLAKPEEVFSDLARRAGENAKHRGVRDPNPSCPECTAVLDRAVSRGIELDVCPEHGTWFDAFELVCLVDALKGRPSKKGFRLGDTRQIVCATCRAKITADRANITQTGLLCEACWRKLETESLAVAEREARKTGAIAVGGALLGVAAVMLGAAAAGSRQS